MLPQISIQELILLFPAILLSLTVHECAHAWVAFRLGDPTARDSGRLTLNPFPHLDPLGTIMLIMTTLSGRGSFGWAKPVPVNPNYFSNPKRDSLLVSVAGPLSNIVLALLFGLIYQHTAAFNIEYLNSFTKLCIGINLGLAFFNLLPLPPLDGSHILIGLLPDRYIPGYVRIFRHAPTVFLVLLAAQWILRINILGFFLDPLAKPFYGFWSAIIALL